jgi:hypothetical protein
MTSSGVTGIGLGMNGMGMTTMGPDGNVDILRRLPQTGGNVDDDAAGCGQSVDGSCDLYLTGLAISQATQQQGMGAGSKEDGDLD